MLSSAGIKQADMKKGDFSLYFLIYKAAFDFFLSQ
jgi:hypothetical protein